MGWKIDGINNLAVKKCIVIVMPHTSWHDFYIALFTRGITGFEMNWVGKKELFKFPFGYYFKYMGGEPLDRSGGLNKVDSIAAIFNKKEVFRLGISPEGTRKKVSVLKTGFYFIAKTANVPIVPVAFDYSKKRVTIAPPFYLTDSIDNDFKNLESNFVGVVGKIANQTYISKK
jgi:1-acyl-sn-glycerol-3-phosphate acyltransferase